MRSLSREEQFKAGLEFVLQHEGGYTHDPADPGGETKFGISKKAHPKEDIKNLTKERASEIYFHEYWLPYAQEWSWPISITVFDTVVNVGHGGLVEILATANKNYTEIGYKAILNARIAYYLGLIQKNYSLSKYKNGWLNRVNDLKKYIELLEEPT